MITVNDLHKIPGIVTPFPKIDDRPESVINGISIDTRTLLPRDIFWAIKGELMDGHSFITQAIEKGALAAVVEKRKLKFLPKTDIPLIIVKDTLKSLQGFAAWHRNRFQIPVIALTGTNGKTTTKEMIAWILQTKYNVHKTIGNLNNHIGTPLTLLRLDADHEISIVEVGTNHPGEIAMLSSLVQPTAALITNIGRGHLEFFSSIKGVAKEKLSLFKTLKREGTTFINLDDKEIRTARIRRKKSSSYSLSNRKSCQIKGMLINLDENGCGSWKLNRSTKIQMKVPGIQNVQNALAASTVCLSMGISEKSIKNALEKYRAYDKRMQIIKNNHTLIINDSYNANPDSFIPALETLNYLSKKGKNRKIAVIGDMLELGNKSQILHRELFQHFIDYNIDAVFTIGSACKAAVDFFSQKGLTCFYSFPNHRDLGLRLKKYTKSGDTILIKGSRGMQMEKVLGHL